jgi:hypothetical protein
MASNPIDLDNPRHRKRFTKSIDRAILGDGGSEIKRLFPREPKRRLPAIVKLKRFLLRVAGDDTREAIKLVERVFKAIPELKGA